VVCVFCAFNITGDIKSLVQISILLNKSEIVADHILEMAGLGEFCDYYL